MRGRDAPSAPTAVESTTLPKRDWNARSTNRLVRAGVVGYGGTMTAARKVYGCPVELSLSLLGGKWKTVILARLEESPMRYGELRRSIPELSDKVLTERLRDLREQGWIEPKDGHYRLTARGESARPLLRALCDWGKSIAPEMHAEFRAAR